MEVLYDPKQEIEGLMDRTTKKCPYCAEIIQYEAIKCKHCHEFLDGRRPITNTSTPAAKPKSKWYQSNGAILIAFCTVGPLAIPLVWANKSYSTAVKIAITAAMLIVTVALCVMLYRMTMSTWNQLKNLGL